MYPNEQAGKRYLQAKPRQAERRAGEVATADRGNAPRRRKTQAERAGSETVQVRWYGGSVTTHPQATQRRKPIRRTAAL